MNALKTPPQRSYIPWLILALGVLLAVLGRSAMGNTDTRPAILSNDQGIPAAHYPSGLQRALEQVGDRLEGRNGFILRSVDYGWVAGYRGASLFSQGDLRRLWLAVCLFDAIDAGEGELSQQAGRSSTLSDQSAVAELVRLAVADNNQAAQNTILDDLGGPQAIGECLHSKGFSEIAFGLPNGVRAKEEIAAHSGVADDLATPDGVAHALAALLSGQVLRRDATEAILALFSPPTGTAAFPKGWRVIALQGAPVGPARAQASASTTWIIRSRSGEQFVLAAFCSAATDAAQRCANLAASVVRELAQKRRGR